MRAYVVDQEGVETPAFFSSAFAAADHLFQQFDSGTQLAEPLWREELASALEEADGEICNVIYADNWVIHIHNLESESQAAISFLTEKPPDG